MPNDLDEETRKALLRSGVYPGSLRKTELPKDAPVTATAGVPGLATYVDPSLTGTTTGGYVFSKFSPKDAIFIQDRKDKKSNNFTVAHEAEHILARRQLGSPSEINLKFDELSSKGKKARVDFVQEAVKAYPYLKEKYNLESGYFQPEMLEFQGRLAPNLLYEQFATLAAIEATTGVDLTKDPVLRKSLFKDRETREIYNAMTGLRQTRLDSKDLAPYTRVEEPATGVVDKLKRLLGYANGGYIPNASNKKVI